MTNRETVLVTGGSQGIGAAIVRAFLDRNYNVVATSRHMSTAGFAESPHLAVVDGDIGKAETAVKITRAAMTTFGSINHVVNDAGIFFAKPFTDYTGDDFHRFVSISLEGFIFLTQLAVRQMLLQGTVAA
jgi:NAD(P)-dependent dehydrogenase (short-subunit alcohol dehydrogenase family)